MRKNTILLLLGMALSIHPASALDATAWEYQQPFGVSATGITRLELPPETLNVSQIQLQDLRLIPPSGGEVPYLVERFTLTPPREAGVRSFKSSLMEGSTVLDLETGSTEAIEAVTIDSPAPDFIKAARVEGSQDGMQWNGLAGNEVIFRQSNGAARLRIPFASASYPRLRITVDDKRLPPVPFTAARIGFTGQPQATLPHSVNITQTNDKPQETVLTVDLGQANLHLAHLRLEVRDPIFSRRVSVSYARDNNGTQQTVPVATAVIYRVTTNDGLGTEWLDLPLHTLVPVSQLTLTIANGDSPPLQINRIEATRQPVTVVFFAGETGTWKLITGNRAVSAPRYDVAALDQPLRQGRATILTPGALSPNPDYEAPPALPQVTSQSVAIDLADWPYRKPVMVTQAGVIQVELDAEVLAHAQFSLGDLRLIQEGRQLPWQLEPTNATRQMPPAVSLESDPKRPTVSLWRLTLPLDGLPALRLTGTSPTALFQRHIQAWSRRPDSPGNEYRSTLGSTTWQHSSSSADQRLVLPFEGTRLPGTFFLETDNGDNPPISLEGVLVEYPVVTLVAKLTESTPAFLYYGNGKAVMPAYDLRLVRQELLSATKQSATLGMEEKLLTGKSRGTGEVEVGSPWLWGALALVIGVLLQVVAKLLPKPEDAPR